MDRLDEIDVKYWELYFSANDLGHKGTMDYAARCPICGDSQKKKKLKRCHLYTKRTIDYDVVHCFNCGWKGNMYSFLETVSPHLYTAYKNEKRATSFNDLVSFNEPQEPKEDDYVIDVSFFDNLREEPTKLFDVPPQFKEIEKGDPFYNYLVSRKMNDEQIKMFLKCNDDIVYNNERVSLKGYIILPLWCKNKLYGFQARSITNKQFYTFVPEENSGFKVWNWYNVDPLKPIYVFESYFDALSSGLDNIVAQLGATLSVDRMAEADDFVFVLDNQWIDSTARTESLKYAKDDHRVMIWPKGIQYKDFNEILKKGGTREKIASFINKNIDEGLTAVIKLTV